jgi:hypothetical protein
MKQNFQVGDIILLKGTSKYGFISEMVTEHYCCIYWFSLPNSEHEQKKHHQNYLSNYLIKVSQ